MSAKTSIPESRVATFLTRKGKQAVGSETGLPRIPGFSKGRQFVRDSGWTNRPETLSLPESGTVSQLASDSTQIVSGTDVVWIVGSGSTGFLFEDSPPVFNPNELTPVDCTVYVRFGESGQNASSYQYSVSAYSDYLEGRLNARLLLDSLSKANSKVRNEIYDSIVEHCTPEDVLDASLSLYRARHKEVYLLQAVSILETFGEQAWPTLRRLAVSNSEECALFVGTIASCENVSEAERVDAMRDLARNPHPGVRDAMVDHHFHEFSDESQGHLRDLLTSYGAERLYRLR